MDAGLYRNVGSGVTPVEMSPQFGPTIICKGGHGCMISACKVRPGEARCTDTEHNSANGTGTGMDAAA